MANWEYQTMRENSPDIVQALVANNLTDSLAYELRAKEIIGYDTYKYATNYGPNITDDKRARDLLEALMSKIQYIRRRYYDVIHILESDKMRADAEVILKLLPKGSGTDTASATSSDQPLASPQQQQPRDTPPFGHTQQAPPCTIAELLKEFHISPDLLDQKCCDEYIKRISLFVDWRGLAPHLGLEKRVIADIKCRTTEFDRRVVILLQWQTRYDSKATLRQLVEDILSTRNVSDAENVCQLVVPHKVHPSLPPSTSNTGVGDTEDALDECDLCDIKYYLQSNFETDQIYNLGITLGLKQKEVKKNKDSDTFLDDVLAAWLDREHNVTRKGLPSWSTLVIALRHPMIGQNGVANVICKDKALPIREYM